MWIGWGQGTNTYVSEVAHLAGFSNWYLYIPIVSFHYAEYSTGVARLLVPPSDANVPSPPRALLHAYDSTISTFETPWCWMVYPPIP